MKASNARPDWNHLYETAADQQGLFTTKQAAEAGYSPQLLVHHVHEGRLVRRLRSIYRLVHFPVGDREELMEVWLWSEKAGVISHESALLLHDLSDVLPTRIHLTLPTAWSHRRFRAPPGVLLYHADVPPQDRSWCGGVPITSPRRSLNDCAKDALSPDLLQQGSQQALDRGLVSVNELVDVEVALAPFGGIAA